MIIPPDVKSEQEMRLRLALLNGLTQIRSGEELMGMLAAVVVIIVLVVVFVLFIAFTVALVKGVQRIPVLYKKNSARDAKTARVMTGVTLALLILCLIAVVVGIAVGKPAISYSGAGLSVLLLIIAYEIINARAGQHNTQGNDACRDPSQLPKNLTLNDVLSWQHTVEQAKAQGK